jgi:hypothetical protein
VPLDVEQRGEKRRIDVKSINRLDHLKLKVDADKLCVARFPRMKAAGAFC